MTDLYHATVQGHGRVVLPAPIRAALGLTPGADLVIRVEDHSAVLSAVPAAVARFQAAVRRHVPAGTALADELIADRRRAAADE